MHVYKLAIHIYMFFDLMSYLCIHIVDSLRVKKMLITVFQRLYFCGTMETKVSKETLSANFIKPVQN